MTESQSLANTRATLRNFAREVAVVPFADLSPASPDLGVAVGMRGELAGPVYVALQNVLKQVEWLEEQSRRQPVMAGSGDPEAWGYGEAARRVLLAIDEGLAG